MKFSEHLLKAFLQIYAVELVGMAYRGILTREADSTGLAAYSKTLKRSSNLAALLKEISYSDEFWGKSLSARARDLVQALYLRLLGREPEAEALESYAAKLAETSDLTPLLAEIARSDEHWERSLTARSNWIGKFDDLKDLCEVVYLPRTENISSTEVKDIVRAEIKDKFLEISHLSDVLEALIKAALK
jgi:hypothetical protein